MALNLIKELSKMGYSRKKNKSFLLNKVKNLNSEDIKKKNRILFNDPNTFLKLPNETNFDYIINKIPKGPQYDSSDKLIPYTMVGNPKYIKMKKFSTSSSKSFNKRIFNSKYKNNTFNKITDAKNGFNFVTDKEIKDIFQSYKNMIKENKNKKKKDLIDSNECTKVMKQYMDKTLSLQEKCLKKKEDNIKNFRNIKDNINQKLKIYANKNKKNNKSYYEANSISKDTYLSMGELLLNSGEEYIFKNQIKSLIDKNNSAFILPNVNHKWENSLRNPKKSLTKKKRLINFKIQTYPYWLYQSEKNSQNYSKSKKNDNYSLYNDYSLRTNSEQNFYFQDSKKNTTNDEIFPKNFFKKNFTSDILEIKGKKLIDVEENMNKKLKGKKKIMKFKNYKEEVKDMVIYSNYSYNNHHTSK